MSIQTTPEKFTIYYVDGRKEILHGSTIANALINAKKDFSKPLGIEYWTKGDDDSFTLMYVPSEDVHRWKLKNGQQIYKQLLDQNEQIFKATEDIQKFRKYMVAAMNQVKKFLEDKTPENERLLSNTVDNFFKSLNNMKTASNQNRVSNPPTKEDYNRIKKEYEIN